MNFKYILLAVVIAACAATHSNSKASKINGVCLEAPKEASNEDVMAELRGIGAAYVALMPYAYMESADQPYIQSEQEWQWWGENEEGIKTMALDAKARGMSVMLKPHLWVRHGFFTGNLVFENRQHLIRWQKDYELYILRYARLAETIGAEMLCIGTELCALIDQDTEYWNDLIRKTKMVYSGKLTYAANWDCYSTIPFWNQLDYIGIDAYFPLTGLGFEPNTPPVEAWDRWKPDMKSLADSLNVSILFTEYGYRSIENGLSEPWTNQEGAKADTLAQIKGYESIYKALWRETWFAGGFLWKWHCKEHLEWGNRSTDFTPQNKPVMRLIQSTYEAHSLMNRE